MNMKKICVAVALAAVMTIAASAAQAADVTMTTTTTAAAAVEKCYGVAKAGKDAAIELPAGVCEKLVNGTLTAPVAEKTDGKMAPKPADKK